MSEGLVLLFPVDLVLVGYPDAHEDRDDEGDDAGDDSEVPRVAVVDGLVAAPLVPRGAVRTRDGVPDLLRAGLDHVRAHDEGRDGQCERCDEHQHAQYTTPGDGGGELGKQLEDHEEEPLNALWRSDFMNIITYYI